MWCQVFFIALIYLALAIVLHVAEKRRRLRQFRANGINGKKSSQFHVVIRFVLRSATQPIDRQFDRVAIEVYS